MSMIICNSCCRPVDTDFHEVHEVEGNNSICQTCHEDKEYTDGNPPESLENQATKKDENND